MLRSFLRYLPFSFGFIANATIRNRRTILFSFPCSFLVGILAIAFSFILRSFCSTFSHLPFSLVEPAILFLSCCLKRSEVTSLHLDSSLFKSHTRQSAWIYSVPNLLNLVHFLRKD